MLLAKLTPILSNSLVDDIVFCLCGQENKEPLPSSWAHQVPLDEDDSRAYYVPSEHAIEYVDMNGEIARAPATNNANTMLWSTCTCFMQPCSETRRREYYKSLFSFCIIVSFIQLIYFIVCLAKGGIVPLSQNMMIGPPGDTLVTLGAAYPPKVQSGQIWRLFTAMLMHAGILHFLMNFLFQWRLGLFLERKWGTIPFAIIYVVAGLTGSVTSVLPGKPTVGVGASGALMGCLGAYFAELLLLWPKTPPTGRLGALVRVGILLAIGLLMGAIPGIDGAAHAGGALAGLLCAFALFSHHLESLPQRLAARIVAPAILGIYLIVSLVCFFVVVKIKISA